MKPLGTRRELQKLAGRLNVLGWFIPRSAEKNLPFFKSLRGAEQFCWTPEQQHAFEQIKEDITRLTTLVSPSLKSTLLLYIAVMLTAVSVALVLESTNEGPKKQMPIYFISEALSGAKTNYSEL